MVHRFALLVCVLVLAACNVLNPSGQPITYRVSGTATSASLTYEGSGGSTEQIAKATLPWTKAYSGGDFKKDDFLYISAQNNTDVGCVTAEILRSDKVLKTANSCGAFVIATASGTNK